MVSDLRSEMRVTTRGRRPTACGLYYSDSPGRQTLYAVETAGGLNLYQLDPDPMNN